MKKTLALALVFLLLVSTFSLLLPKVRALEQFGKTDQGANRWYFWNWFAKVVSRFQAPEDGEITNITFYGLPVGSGMQFRAVVYSDNAGVPDALLAYGNQVPLSITQGWQSAPISLNITGGTYYWIGIQYTGNGRIDFWYDPGAPSQTAWNIDAFYPDDPFGTPSYENYELSIYAGYKPSGPRTWTVDDDRVEYPSADFTSIQEAINASRPEDTIYVYRGTYYEHLLLNKTLSIIGENPKTTIIDGNGTGVNIDISSGVVRIDGFTIQNGSTGIHIFGPGIRADITNSHLRWNDYGLLADDFSDLVIRSSNATYNEYGVSINNAVLPGNVSLTGNNLANNTYNIRINGSVPLAFNSIDIDPSNTINGKPIYYMKNQRDLIIDSSTHPDVGYLGLVSSTNITVRDLTVTENYEGILLAYTNDSTIQNVTSSNNMLGIAVYGSDNNTVYHNAFINNTNQVYLFNSFNNTWDNGYPSGGNYWSNHNGTDADHDGIGDTPYVIDADNTDYYPLVYPTFFWPRPPTYSDVGTNTTVAGQPALFHAKWSDDQEAHRWNKDGLALSGFIFSTNNTGSWRNSTWTPLSGSVAWSNITEVLNSTAGVTVQYRFYCNDTYNGWGSTPILTISVLGVDVNPKFASLQVGQSQTFSATALGGTPPYTIEWIDYVTKQVIGTGTNYTFYAVAEGSYQIYAQATDSLGTTASSDVIPITVYAPPVASFTYIPFAPFVGETVTFDASASDDSDGTIVSYDWDFGDNSTGFGMVIDHVYAEFGTYTVNLTVTDNDGLTDSTTAQITVHALPIANFTYSPDPPLAGKDVIFDASVSYDPDGTIVSYTWNFGDSNVTTVTTPIITHVYTTLGTYTVNLTVTDNDGLEDSVVHLVEVHAPPVASFTYSPSEPLVGELVTFNSTSSDEDGVILSWEWDLDGDGIVDATTENATWTYTTSGTYTVTLTVTDNDGFTDSTTAQITVNAPPPLTTSISPSSPQFVQVGGTIVFALTVDGGVPLYTQQWFVNSTPVAGETGTAFNFSSAVEGTFIVFARVTDGVGATVDSNVTKVTVAAPPQKFKSEIRALFVHSMSLYYPDWEVIAETARSYGINTLIVEILTSTGARYPSEYVPVWTRDELTPAIAAAHARGMSLYISYDVLLGALTDEYKVQDHNGALLNWTDPTKAISKALIRNLIEEVSSYDIDGIMLDYIRYDSNDMCYGPECRAAFERYLGETITNWPGDFAPGGARYNEFMEWRPHPINYLVRDIRSWALAVNPDLEISAAVWGWEPIDPTYNRYWMGQDSAFWVKEGWLDWVAPMIYTTDINRIDEKMKSYQQYMVAGPEGKIPLVPFLTNAWPAPVDPNNFTQQIDTVRANGADGWIIWRYGGPGDGQGSGAPDIRTYLDLIDLYPTFSLRNINISVVGDRHVVTWTTKLPTTSMVEYGLSPLFTATLEVLPLTGRNYWEPAHVLGTIIQNSTLRTEHSFEILIPGGTPFYLRIQSRDGQGNATSLVFGIAITGQGILTVETTPVAGDIYIDGQLMGSGNWSGSVYVGTHFVSYGVVLGYVSPRAQVVDVFENQTTMVIGIYVRLYSAISMWVSSSPALVGYEVNIVGSLMYQHNSSGIANVPVQLYRSIMGADSIIALTTTNLDGSFSVTWFSLASGDYIIKAVYAGDSDVDGTETAVNLIIRDIEERVFSVSSNSTVSSLTFNSTSRVITFTVSGPAGTMGYVNIFLSKDLVSDINSLKVYFDGLEKSYEAVSLDDIWFIHLSYNHSIHTIRIALPIVLPAYTLQPFTTQIMAVMVIALAVALTGAFFIRKKKFRE